MKKDPTLIPRIEPVSLQGQCPCEKLGILMLDEAPHTSAEICKNALASTLMGKQGTSVTGLLRKVDHAIAEHQKFCKDHGYPDRLRIARAELARAVTLLKGDK